MVVGIYNVIMTTLLSFFIRVKVQEVTYFSCIHLVFHPGCQLRKLVTSMMMWRIL